MSAAARHSASLPPTDPAFPPSRIGRRLGRTARSLSRMWARSYPVRQRFSLGKRLAMSAALSRCILSTTRWISPIRSERLSASELRLLDRARTPNRSAVQHDRQLEHVVAGLAVEAGALAARVGVDHAADCGPI